MLLLFLFAEDELNLLVIIVDTNPIWWGKQALKGSQVRWLEPTILLNFSLCNTHYPASSIESLQAGCGGPRPVLALRWRQADLRRSGSSFQSRHLETLSERRAVSV